MTLGDFFEWLFRLFGIKDSDEKKYKKLEDKLRAHKAANVDRLEGLKEEIGRLEKRALAKKKEYDDARGETKHIIANEIKRLFSQLDQLRDRDKIIGSNIRKLDLAVAKIGEARDAQAQGIDQDILDEIALDLEDLFKDLEDVDKAAEDLKDISYEPPEEETLKATESVAEEELVRDEAALLPDELEERLKNLEGGDREGEESEEAETGEEEAPGSDGGGEKEAPSEEE